MAFLRAYFNNYECYNKDIFLNFIKSVIMVIKMDYILLNNR